MARPNLIRYAIQMLETIVLLGDTLTPEARKARIEAVIHDLRLAIGETGA